MMKRVMIVMGLLGMGIAAGFAVFVTSSFDNNLLATNDDENCLWAYSSGTLELEYEWGPDINSHPNWQTAFEFAVDEWNDLDTNVEWSNSGSADNVFDTYSKKDNQVGYNLGTCQDGYDGYRVANLTFGNTYYNEYSPHNRGAVASHEVGHAMAMFHSSYNTHVMFQICCPQSGPTSNDEGALNALY